jgi:ferric enterobactin receptor
MNLKKILAIVTLIAFSSLSIFAQNRRPVATPAHIFGKVIDSKKVAIGYASVLILKTDVDPNTKVKKEVLLTGVNTDDNGEFSIEDIPFIPSLKLQITYFGFENYETVLSFKPGESEYDLGKISLTEKTQDLDEVTVTATIASMKMDVDKKVFNVGANSITTGGTGQDVLKNVPSVNVDIDGNVSIRNSAPQILLDGRPTTLTPDQIPADAIESIEVYTNPSAKFDASGGSGGIVNIVLKKNKKTGYNGSIRAGLDDYGGGNFGIDFNVRQNKINFFSNINSRLESRITSNDVFRTNLFNGIDQIYTTQIGEENSNGNFNNGKIGFDYFVTNKTTISLSGQGTIGKFNPTTFQNITEDSLIGTARNSYSYRASESDRSFKNNGLVFGVKHLFTTVGDELSFDFNYNHRIFENSTNFSTDFFKDGLNSAIEKTIGQKIEGLSDSYSYVIQTDLIKNIFDKVKLEAGLRANINGRLTKNNNYFVDPTTKIQSLVDSPNSDFKNNDAIYAAYGTLAKQFNKFAFKTGLRAESSYFNGELIKSKQKFSNKFPFELFPSAFISYKVSEKDAVQFSYTRRIKRPNFFQNVPFADSTDRYNITKGNADLIPEFTSAFDMGYMKRFANESSLLTSIYYKYTDGLISNYLIKDSNGTLINTFINANSSYAAGAEVTLQYFLSRIVDFNININVYNSKINLAKLSEEDVLPTALWSYFTKVNTNLKFKNNLTMQLSGNYQSKANQAVESGGGEFRHRGGAQTSAQGYIAANYTIDLAIRKSFAKNKYSVTIGVNDIFRTRYNTAFSSNQFFNQEYKRLSNPQLFKINFAYNFGKADAVLFKRKSKGAEEAPE